MSVERGSAGEFTEESLFNGGDCVCRRGLDVDGRCSGQCVDGSFG